jgi:hypothetical protein
VATIFSRSGIRDVHQALESAETWASAQRHYRMAERAHVLPAWAAKRGMNEDSRYLALRLIV